MPTPHKHAALIKQWADDPSQPVWLWAGHEWVSPLNPDCPLWLEYVHHAVGPKPTQPPRKMCSLAGVEFPMPELEAPEIGEIYFVSNDMNPERPFRHSWNGTEFDTTPLAAGYLHLTHEAAEQHGRAILAANKQAIEGAR